MESSLDLATRLIVEAELKSLYSWSLQEFRADGQKAVGGAFIPWPWSLYYRATDFHRTALSLRTIPSLTSSSATS